MVIDDRWMSGDGCHHWHFEDLTCLNRIQNYSMSFLMMTIDGIFLTSMIFCSAQYGPIAGENTFLFQSMKASMTDDGTSLTITTHSQGLTNAYRGDIFNVTQTQYRPSSIFHQGLYK